MIKLVRDIVEDGNRRASAWFVVLDDLIYPTIEHPSGQSPEPWFRISGNHVYPHTGHPLGPGVLPWYERFGELLIATSANPEADTDQPMRFA